MRDVIICGGGYSVKEGIDKGLWDKIKNKEIWSLNYAYKAMPYLPTREIWLDKHFFKINIEELQKLYKQKVECIAKFNDIYCAIKDIITYEGTQDKTLFGKDKIMFTGSMNLVGFFALSLALYEKIDRVYLLGYDFGNSGLNNKLTHFYQDSVPCVSSGVGRPDVYRLENNKIKNEVKDFELYTHQSTKIYNVSLNSNIPYFTKLSWEYFFYKIN